MAFDSTRISLRSSFLCASLVMAGCASAEPYSSTPITTGTGGSSGSGGPIAGATGSGGAGTGVGGATGPVGTGGRTGTGGGTVGPVGTGGRAGTGGTNGPVGSGGTVAIPGSGGRTGAVPVFRLPWMDDFEANTVNAAATGWIQDPKDTTGHWLIAMDGTSKVLAEQVAVSSLSRIVGGDSAWTDMKVEVRVKFSTVSSSSLALLGVRFVDFDNYYFAHLQGDGALKIRKRIAGSTTDLVTFKSNVPLVVGTWYTFGFTFQGTTVTLSYNGAVVGTMTETAASLSAGGIMLGVQTGVASFDDVKVTAP